MPVKALYIFPPSVGIASGRPLSSNYFVGFQADFCLDSQYTRATIQLPPPTPTAEREHGIPIRQATHDLRHSVSPWSSSFADINCVQPHGLVYPSISNGLAVLHLKTITDQ
jgi:hypothetical protein